MRLTSSPVESAFETSSTKAQAPPRSSTCSGEPRAAVTVPTTWR